ncbi:glycoside hydrolase family 88 protein [Niabella aquatica]
MKKVADWQLNNPTGKQLNSWEYAPFYTGLMALYQTCSDRKYYDAIMDMGRTVNWEPVARPYDANVLAISQVFLELYEITGLDYMIDKSRFVMDATMQRELDPDITFDKNKYWWEWWSWCDALFMAPPAYARLAILKKEPKYMDHMIREWKRTSGYLYAPGDSLFFRDDRFFKMKSANGARIFWSRGNGWVVGGLARILQYMPKDHKSRGFFENQFRQMCYKLKQLQMPNGFWSQSLLDPQNYPQKESSGTGFFVYAMTWGVNNHLLEKEIFLPVIEKGWKALITSLHPNGKLGYVQEVGDAPTNVKYEDSETYGTGAFLLAGSEVYKLLSAGSRAWSPVPVISGNKDRDYAINMLVKISDPVLDALSKKNSGNYYR